jgi:hypothetical protein
LSGSDQNLIERFSRFCENEALHHEKGLGLYRSDRVGGKAFQGFLILVLSS